MTTYPTETCSHCGEPDPTGFECCQDCAETLWQDRKAETPAVTVELTPRGFAVVVYWPDGTSRTTVGTYHARYKAQAHADQLREAYQ